MLQKTPQKVAQSELFQTRLEHIIDPTHELAKLALMID